MVKRFVILGASGFIGTNLVQQLKIKGQNFLAPNSYELNLVNRSSVAELGKLYKQGDHIIILAGLSPYRGNDIKSFSNNLMMVDNIKNSINHKVHHITYVSSDAVYNNTACYVDENTQPSPNGLYGAMHLSREILLSELGSKLSIVRPTMVFGGNDPHNAYGPNRFLKSSSEKGFIKIYGRGEELRDYIEIKELIKLLIQTSELAISGVLNLVSGKSSRFIDLAELIVKSHPKTEIIFEKDKLIFIIVNIVRKTLKGLLESYLGL
jgi:UDP-glucose 4-epimerase